MRQAKLVQTSWIIQSGLENYVVAIMLDNIAGTGAHIDLEPIWKKLHRQHFSTRETSIKMSISKKHENIIQHERLLLLSAYQFKGSW